MRYIGATPISFRMSACSNGATPYLVSNVRNDLAEARVEEVVQRKVDHVRERVPRERDGYTTWACRVVIGRLS